MELFGFYCHRINMISFQVSLDRLCWNSMTHSNRLILWWFTIQDWHRGLEPCLICGCCVNLSPWAVWRAMVTGSQGQGQAGLGPVCGKHLMDARVPHLGLQKPDSSRRLSEGRRCRVWSFGEPPCSFPDCSQSPQWPCNGATEGPQMSAALQGKCSNAGGETAQFLTSLIPQIISF